MEKYKSLLLDNYNIDKSIINFVDECENLLIEKFNDRKKISQYNQVKILNSMQKNKLQATDFNWTTGYGYGDIGRRKSRKYL